MAIPPLIVFDGGTFFASDDAGNVESAEGGFFFQDVRHLSRWNVSLRGLELRAVTSKRVDYFSARVVLIPHDQEPEGLSLTRDRFVTDGVHEDLVLRNDSEDRRRVHIELAIGADFADVMEAEQGNGPAGGRTWVERRARSLTITHERDGYRRGTVVSFRRRPHLTRSRAVFGVVLAPGESWSTCIDVMPVVDGKRRRSLVGCGAFAQPATKGDVQIGKWIAHAPALETHDVSLRRTYACSIRDLAALRIRPDELHVPHAMPGGGLPWFMTVFGRDSLLASYQALPFHADLAQSTLATLAHLQATEWDNDRDAEPGKIPHELRRGILAKTGRIPHTPYYGTHDATPLFLILLDEYERWTGDVALVRELEPNARAALAWLEGAADLDGDGYVEYRRRSQMPHALDNHCWKDSDDGVVWPDGRRVEPPIATCELQGYAYAARLSTARLAREVWRDRELAGRLESEAAALRDRFDRDFWLREGWYAFALDGSKKRVPTLTSNVGHLLWSGIVPERRAPRLARLLASERLASGWGVRTLALGQPAFDPLSYHRGSVWPHDTAIVAEGLRRYGFRDEAGRLCEALFDAAAAFDHRLPEVFGGFARDDAGVTVEYPEALTPQAWAAAAPLLALRTLLGLDVVGGRLRTRPHVPDRYGRLRLRGVRVRGESRDAD
jgi:glycogen debranching enzyme